MAIAMRNRTRRTVRGGRKDGVPHSVVELVSQSDLRSRARRLLGREIDFIANAEFRHPDARRKILGRDGTSGEPEQQSHEGSPPKDLPAHLARLCESRLLSADEERKLFRRMNYLKYRANVLRVRLNPDNPDSVAMDEAERLLSLAGRVRDHLIKANMRLVIAIVKKFVTPRHSFDDLLSDGIVSLMQAVEKFD